MRLVLLVASGVMLGAGVGGALSGRFDTLSTAERAMALVGLALLATAWIGVARAALKR